MTEPLDTQPPRVRWEVSGRGPRVIVEIGGEEFAISPDAAKRLLSGLARTMEAIGVGVAP